MYKSNKQKFKIVFDMCINLVGTGIGLVILQICIYPLVARKIDAEIYGQMQSIMSMIYLLGGVFGGTLCTTRLIREYEYRENNIKADFNIIFFADFVIVLVAMPILIKLYLGEVNLISLILITLIGILDFCANYFHVGLRLILSYKDIFIERMLACVGYVIGFFIFSITLRWEYIFICAFLFQSVYALYKYNLLKEPWKKSYLFSSTFRSYFNLSIATLLKKALTYFDKLLLYPLLGGEAVAIYSVANTFGKLILKIVEPITNVIVSYLSKRKSVTPKIIRIVIPVSMISCIVLYILCMIVSKPILTLLYPQWMEQAVKLIPITTLALAISTFINLLYPFTLKMLEEYKQIIVNAVGLLSYIIAIVILYQKYSLQGCCISTVISYCVKLCCMMFFVKKKL